MTALAHLPEPVEPNNEPLPRWFIKVVVSGTVGVLLFLIIHESYESIKEHWRPRNAPLEFSGIWTADFQGSGLFVPAESDRDWNLLLNSQGFRLQVAQFDPYRGTASGDIRCAQNSHAVGTWMIEPAKGAPNRLALRLSFFDGGQAEPTFRRAE